MTIFLVITYYYFLLYIPSLFSLYAFKVFFTCLSLCLHILLFSTYFLQVQIPASYNYLSSISRRRHLVIQHHLGSSHPLKHLTFTSHFTDSSAIFFLSSILHLHILDIILFYHYFLISCYQLTHPFFFNAASHILFIYSSLSILIFLSIFSFIFSLIFFLLIFLSLFFHSSYSLIPFHSFIFIPCSSSFIFTSTIVRLIYTGGCGRGQLRVTNPSVCRQYLLGASRKCEGSIY